MIDAVFISDLHLSPYEPAIVKRFELFIEWALQKVRSVYILGDFFHAWAGDDTMDEWEKNIAKQLARFHENGISLYYLHGNRDFLLGEQFADLSCMKILKEPYLLRLNGTDILLTHGDRYCTNDKSHQWLRKLTRNRVFKRMFLSLSANYRKQVVRHMRAKSMRSTKTLQEMDVVPQSLLRHMKSYNVQISIHGHTHKPGHTIYATKEGDYHQYVLSDWDDTPQFLCYDNSKRLYFELLWGRDGGQS